MSLEDQSRSDRLYGEVLLRYRYTGFPSARTSYDNERGEQLFLYACHEAGQLVSSDCETERRRLFGRVSVENELLRNPLPDSKAEQIAAAAFACRQRCDARQGRLVMRHGLELDPETHQWFPGQWRLQRIIDGSKVTMRLIVPAWERFTRNRDGAVDFTLRDFVLASPKKVAVIVAEGTRLRVLLEDLPTEWRRIWSGADDRRSVTSSLKKLLADESEEIRITPPIRGPRTERKPAEYRISGRLGS